MSKRCVKGFTLLELAIVFTILAILAAILYPIFVRSANRAKQTSCEEKMHQLFLAIDLYRSDYGGQGVLGSMAAMALPPNLVVLKHAQNLDRELFRCTGSTELYAHPVFTYMPIPAQLWEDLIEKDGSNAIMLLDDNHQDRPGIERAPMMTHFAFGYTVEAPTLNPGRPVFREPSNFG